MKKIFQFKSGTDKYYPNCYYPVGFIFITIGDKSPASIYGGTWELLKDRFLIGAGNKYSLGATGGEETHILTINEMPNHDHPTPSTMYTGVGGLGYSAIRTEIATNGIIEKEKYLSTGGVGGSQAHNNMPPYLAVYFWKKISE